MRAEDVTDTIELALAASGCDQAVVRHKPRLLSDNGSCYISGDLAEWLEGQKMTHVVRAVDGLLICLEEERSAWKIRLESKRRNE